MNDIDNLDHLKNLLKNDTDICFRTHKPGTHSILKLTAKLLLSILINSIPDDDWNKIISYPEWDNVGTYIDAIEIEKLKPEVIALLKVNIDQIEDMTFNETHLALFKFILSNINES